MSGNRTHVEEWAEFVDAEIPRTVRIRTRDEDSE